MIGSGTTTMATGSTTSWTVTVTGALTSDDVLCCFAQTPPYYNSLDERYVYQIGAAVTATDTVTFYREPSGTPTYNDGATIFYVVYRNP